MAGHEADIAEVAARDRLANVLVEGIEADVEVDGVDLARPLGLLDERRRLRCGHRQRLLADDVLAGGEDRRGLRDVEVVGRGDVDDAHGTVSEDLLERGVGVADAERIGPGRAALARASEDAADVDPDPAELLDVDGPDESRADDGGADR